MIDGDALVDTVVLTIELATLTTAILLLLATPLAWALAQGRGWLTDAVGAVASLPLILPPTVLGFYLLLALAPQGPVSAVLGAFGVAPLAFSFPGLVLGSVVYSLPFAVQPIRDAFRAVGERPLAVAASLGAGPLDRFFSVALPLARRGLITGAILSFAHTVGEFGVVLMIGGNIPRETRVVSIAIFDHVEAGEWREAHYLAGGLAAFAFLVILVLQRFGRLGPGGDA